MFSSLLKEFFLNFKGEKVKTKKRQKDETKRQEEDIGEPQKHILHFIDNDACVDNIVLSKFVMKNTKYMEIKYSWLREKWEDGTIWPVKISSGENISDCLTKAAEIRGSVFLSLYNFDRKARESSFEE